MEFTENQYQPLKRMSRLGFVALLHVALLAALLSSMKITITQKPNDPITVKFEEAKKIDIPEITDPVKNTVRPLTPPIYVPTPPDVTLPTDNPPISNTTSDPNVAKEVVPKGDQGKVALLGELPSRAKNPIHVAAVINFNACDKPAYPASSIRNGETGTVTLSMLIGTDGKVVETKTMESSGYRALDRAATQALSLCRFTPGTIDGVAQQSWTKVQYVWKID